MKSRFFISAVRNLDIVYRMENKLYGGSFELKLVISSDRLNKNGFVLDFLEVEKVLDRLEGELKGKEANEITGKDDFDFRDFLVFIKDFVDKSLNNDHILVSEVSLTGSKEGFIARFSD